MKTINGGMEFPPTVDYLLFGNRNIYHGYLLFYQLIQKTKENGLSTVGNITIIAFAL